MLYLASYIGKGLWFDGLVRWWTKSDTSHSEIATKNADGIWVGFSSSPRDGGVRFKQIDFDSGHWRLTPLSDVDEAEAMAEAWRIHDTRAGYDWMGILWAQLFNSGRHNRHRWFCSELCAHVMGLSDPHTYSPGRLDRKVLEGNAT